MGKDFPCSRCGVSHPIGEHVGRAAAAPAEKKVVRAVERPVRSPPEPVVRGVVELEGGLPPPLEGCPRCEALRKREAEKKRKYRAGKGGAG